jgi:hypothetical protein
VISWLNLQKSDLTSPNFLVGEFFVSIQFDSREKMYDLILADQKTLLLQQLKDTIENQTDTLSAKVSVWLTQGRAS